MKNLTAEIGLVLINTTVLLLGVLFFGWPLGNLFFLIWFENLLLTVIAVIRMIVYRKLPGGDLSSVVAFGLGMVIFCLVHLGLTMPLAYGSGFEATATSLLLPAALLIVRYLLEALGDISPQRQPTKFWQTFSFPLSRIMMLHVVIFICTYVVVDAGIAISMGDTSHIVILAAVLLGIKTAFEIGGLLWRMNTHAKASLAT